MRVWGRTISGADRRLILAGWSRMQRRRLPVTFWQKQWTGSRHTLNIVAHVHDEVIIEAPKDQYTVEEICKLMSENPAWCKGLPLAAAGYKGNYYFKD